MNPTPEQVAASEAEEREAEAFVATQWKAADEWLAAEWPHATDGERAVARSAWTELARRADDAVSWDYHWLVELFHRGDAAPSMGRYHTGLTDITHQSRSTTQAHEARRYAKEEAQRVAEDLNRHMMACEWRAVEHGFLVAAGGVMASDGGQPKGGA